MISSSKIMNYYMTNSFYLPPALSHRECGAWVKGVMWRHLTFENLDKLRAFCIEHTPTAVYFSAAKYEHPYRKNMIELKESWIGSDLIFDIDDDHLEVKTLVEAKKHAVKLINILREDFGFKDFTFIESGGRGYHVHVRDGCVQTLGTYERREIADYFMKYYPHTTNLNENYVGLDIPVTTDVSRLIRWPGTLNVKKDSCGVCKVLRLPSTPENKDERRLERTTEKFMVGRL